ncbi:MAG: BNR-4 repeat-containing protein, partial [Thermoguttaceae bacterium]|nr:BNR-4 repeat-containing protein [Thermoguttaceae bacterium]
WRLREREDVADVWSGVTVSFGFKVRSDALYVAFYAADRSLTVARRPIGAGNENAPWEFKSLPTKISWDSHNYPALEFDRENYLHVSGNMHASPLTYFRASRPNDVASLEQIPTMTGAREKRATYPRFFFDKEGRLIFNYRDGGSGNGDDLWNVYDEVTKTWAPLIEKPLFDGEGARNAYATGPRRGPDGRFHNAWCWRDTPDCATNNNVSYVRSEDLIHWEKSNGEPIELPIKRSTGEIIDPIPSGGGALNPLIRLAFDAEKRPVVGYTKRDEKGALQIWTSRPNGDGSWTKEPATDWDYVWNFSGGGTIIMDLNFSAVSPAPGGRLSLTWSQASSGKSGRIYLDAATLRPTSAPEQPASPAKVIPEFAPEDA